MNPKKPKTLITGGSSGIGLAMARQLGTDGHEVGLIARTEATLQSAAEELKALGIEVFTYTADVSHPNELEAVFSRVQEEMGHVDFLICNAGMVQTRCLEDYTSAEDLRSVLDVNLLGTIFTCRTFLPLVPRGGRILLIASLLGLLGAAGYSTYCASKAGIITFGESFRRELLNKGIHVYVACPPDVDTRQYRGELAGMPAWMKRKIASRLKPISAEVCAKRILAKSVGNRSLILISWEGLLLQTARRLVPLRVYNRILDRIFPIP